MKLEDYSVISLFFYDLEQQPSGRGEREGGRRAGINAGGG